MPVDTPFMQEDLPPDFWEGDAAFEPPGATRRDRRSEADSGNHRPTVAAASHRATDLTEGDEPAEGPNGSPTSTFATLRKLFPGRVLDVEPLGSPDDAPAPSEGAAGYSDETDDAAPGDAGAQATEVD